MKVRVMTTNIGRFDGIFKARLALAYISISLRPWGVDPRLEAASIEKLGRIESLFHRINIELFEDLEVGKNLSVLTASQCEQAEKVWNTLRSRDEREDFIENLDDQLGKKIKAINIAAANKPASWRHGGKRKKAKKPERKTRKRK